MKTQIRQIIEHEMVFGPAKTFAERLEAALLKEIRIRIGLAMTTANPKQLENLRTLYAQLP